MVIFQKRQVHRIPVFFVHKQFSNPGVTTLHYNTRPGNMVQWGQRCISTYKTIDIARIIGIHVNTVRLYEKCSLIPKPERLSNGYRVFTDLHVEQFKLARAALQVEVLQNGLRKQAVDIVKVSASGNYEKAMELTGRYISQIDSETANAEEAIQITRSILSGIGDRKVGMQNTYRRKEAADILPLTQGIKLLKATSLGLPLESVWLSIAVMAVLAVVCGGLAICFFKWE